MGELQDGVGMTTDDNTPAASSAPDAGGGSASSGSGAGSVAPTPGGACALPADGCPCDHEGAAATCLGPKVHTGNYISCAPAARECHEGTWGACEAKTVYQSAGALTEDAESPCGTTTRVRWGALTLAGASPGDAEIDVSAQTAATAAGLDSAPIVRLDPARAATLSSWTSVDVEAALAGRGESSQRWLRLTVDVVGAGSAGAVAKEMRWAQASTCVAVSP
jgi:hypothetical protein